MPPDRRLRDSADAYPDDRGLVAAVLREPDDVGPWPAVGLAARGFTAGQQALAVTWRLDTEVRNGGFGHWFAALGADALEATRHAVRALERLGAAEHRALVEEALARFECGLPGAPAPFVARSEADSEGPLSEARYDASLRRMLGSLGPDLESVRERAAARRAWEAALRIAFGAFDDRWRALHAGGAAMEGFWARYVRENPAEFFTR